MSAEWIVDLAFAAVCFGLTLALLFGVWGVVIAADALARRLIKHSELSERDAQPLARWRQDF